MGTKLTKPGSTHHREEDSNPATTPFVRDSLNDDGSTPNTGAINVSPDIIPQQSPANPNQIQQLFGQATYGSDVGQNIKYKQSNYIYLRAKNPTASSQEVTISVYWSRPSTLQYPSQWQNNLIGAAQTITLPASTSNGGVLAAPQPCIWTPLQLPEPGHYCLITELSWPGQPPVPSSFPTLDDWWKYCKDNNTIAQRNIDIINDLPNGTLDRWLDLLNPTSQEGGVHKIEAICNVPANSSVMIYCSSDALQPPIDTTETITATNNGQIVSSGAVVFPAYFQGTLELKFIPPQNAPAGSYSIVIKQKILVDGNYELLGSYTFEIQI